MRGKLKAENKAVFSILYPVFSILLVILLDQVSKIIVVSRNIPYVCNSGVAFGFSLGWWSIAVGAGILALVLWQLARESKPLNVVALSLIAGGGISNIVDRLISGCVRDFVDFKIWPDFNLADSAITIGTVVLIFLLFFRKQNEV